MSNRRSSSNSLIDSDKFIQHMKKRPILWDRKVKGGKSRQTIEQTWIDLAKLHRVKVAEIKGRWKCLRDMFRVEYKKIPRDAQGELLMETEDFNSKWPYYRQMLFLVEHMRSRDEYTFSVNEHYLNNNEWGEISIENALGDSDNFEDTNETFPMPLKSELKIESCQSLTIPDVFEQLPPKKRIRKHSSSSPITTELLLTPSITLTTQEYEVLPSVAKNMPSNETDYTQRISSTDKDNNFINQEFFATNRNQPDNDDSEPVLKDSDYHFLVSLHPYMLDLMPIQKLRVRMKMQKLIFKELYGGGGEDEC